MPLVAVKKTAITAAAIVKINIELELNSVPLLLVVLVVLRDSWYDSYPYSEWPWV